MQDDNRPGGKKRPGLIIGAAFILIVVLVAIYGILGPIFI